MEIEVYCGHIGYTQKWPYHLLMLLVCWSSLYWVGVSIGLCDVLFYGIVILTVSVLRIDVTCQGTNVKSPDGDKEILKHVGVCIIRGPTQKKKNRLCL